MTAVSKTKLWIIACICMPLLCAFLICCVSDSNPFYELYRYKHSQKTRINKNVSLCKDKDGNTYVYNHYEHAFIGGYDWVTPIEDVESILVASGLRMYLLDIQSGYEIESQELKVFYLSEGLFALSNKGHVVFYDINGKKILDRSWSLSDKSLQNLTLEFHNGYCVIENSKHTLGIIDKNGDWKLNYCTDISDPNDFGNRLVISDSLYFLWNDKDFDWLIEPCPEISSSNYWGVRIVHGWMGYSLFSDVKKRDITDCDFDRIVYDNGNSSFIGLRNRVRYTWNREGNLINKEQTYSNKSVPKHKTSSSSPSPESSIVGNRQSSGNNTYIPAPSFERPIMCPHCNGLGQVGGPFEDIMVPRHMCVYCQGYGYLSRQVADLIYDAIDHKNTSYSACPRCNGTGRCPICKGMGYTSIYGYTKGCDCCDRKGGGEAQYRLNGNGKCSLCHGTGRR